MYIAVQPGTPPVYFKFSDATCHPGDPHGGRPSMVVERHWTVTAYRDEAFEFTSADKARDTLRAQGFRQHWAIEEV